MEGDQILILKCQREYKILGKTLRPHFSCVVLAIIKITHFKSVAIYVNSCCQL